MFKIKKFNNISDAIYNYLDKESYEVSEDFEAYDAALVRSKKLFDENFPKNLLAIARAGAGTDNIPVDKCTQNGIVVFNTHGANANAVKELAICGMILSCRKIVDGINWVKEQKDNGNNNISVNMENAKKAFVGREIYGKKLGLIGVGAVGSLVANSAIDLGLKVYGYDPYLSVDAALRLSPQIKMVKDRDEIFKNCDFISVHLPLTDNTRDIINKDNLKLFKNDCVLMNFARGELVNTDALLEALDNQKLGRYVTDFPNDKIAGHPNVIATPHLGASTPEAEENCAIMAAKELDDFIKTGNIKNSVNIPNCEMAKTDDTRITIINKNIPNMVGQITSVLANEGYNITHMNNRSKGDIAYTMIDIENKIDSTKITEKLEKINGVIKVRVI